MKFNEYIWKMYLNTNEAKNALDIFNNFSSYLYEKKEVILNIYKSIHLDEVDENDFYEIIDTVIDAIKEEHKKIINKNINSLENALIFFKEKIETLLINEDGTTDSPRDFFSDGIIILSLLLYKQYPEYFFPYFFDGHFFKLQDIFEEFNIMLPEIPGKRNYKERLFYYFDLCKSLYEFKLLMNFSSSELCVFLYFFAPNFIRNPLKEEIPKPTKVYISGATEDDSKWINELKNNKTVTRWAGNLNTQPGDILLIYGVSPYSSINSIWQAISYGYSDPFDYWMDRVWVSNFIKIHPITFEKLQKNKIWSQKGIIKAHMQGISGTPCSKIEYQEIINILKGKGFDTSILQEVPEIGFSDISEDIFDEKDVEQKLLEPLLERLGYSSKNWIRQMPLRMGRGIRYYPDYVINPKTTSGEEKADFIWEAKLSISNEKKLKEDFYQTKSYALRLKTKGLGLISKEGIWISFNKNDFSFNKIEYYNWNDINNFDIFNKLLIKIGKK